MWHDEGRLVISGNLVLIPANADVMINIHPRSHGVTLEKWSLCYNGRDNRGDVPLSYAIIICEDKEAALFFLLDNGAYLHMQ